MVCNTIPFGWKASAYVYHTMGMAATSYIRSLGIPCSQYIDDRHFGQLISAENLTARAQSWSEFELAEAATFIAASVLTSLGYFLSLANSSLVPRLIVRFLGFMVDSVRQAFILPDEKKRKFATLREDNLGSRCCPLLRGQAGRGGIWSDELGSGNSASHHHVTNYLKAIKEEQPQAGVRPRRAVPPPRSWHTSWNNCV